MTIGRKKRGRTDGDPVFDGPRGKSRSQRKSGRDMGALTPTEQHTKNRLMRQFMRLESGAGGTSEEYRRGYEKIRWDR